MKLNNTTTCNKVTKALPSLLNNVSDNKTFNTIEEVREDFSNMHKHIPNKGQKYIVCNKCNTIQTPIYFDRGSNREKMQDCWQCGEIMNFTPETLPIMS